MRFLTILAIWSAAVTAVGSAATSAEAAAGSATRVSGTYVVDTQAKAKTDCKPLSKTNPGVLQCTVKGFTLVYRGALQGTGVNTFRWIVDCVSGKSYTDGTETFTGSVDGVGSGTLTWGVRSTGTFDCKKGEVTGVSAIENLYAGTAALGGMFGTMHRGSKTYSGVLRS